MVATTTDTANGINSPRSPPPQRQNLQWASIVRGGRVEPSSTSPPPPTTAALVSPPPEPTRENPPPIPITEENPPPVPVPVMEETTPENGGGQQPRPVWNTTPSSNGVVQAGPIMGGAVTWPALSESTRPVPRSWPETTRPAGDGSVSTSQAPIIAQPPPQRTSHTNSHPHPAANNTGPARPRSRNRGGGSSSGSGPSQHNNFNRPAAPAPAPLGPPFPVFEAPFPMVPNVPDAATVRGPRAVGNSQPHPGNEHSPQPHRNNSRRGNFGPRPRGEGQYHNNHNQGGRRDQDRRDIHLTPPFVPPPVVFIPQPPMPPPGTGPFMPGPMRMFPAQMGYDMPPSFYYPVPPESFRPMAVNVVPPVIFSPMNESPVATTLVKQIDYYFSDDNLVKDKFLRSHMDDNGWVPVSLIASFPRVQSMSKDINEILEAMRHATNVELQGDKVRRRNDWSRWLTSGSNNDSGSRTPGAVTENVMATSLQQISLDDSENSVPNANGIVGTSQGHTETTVESMANGEEDASEAAH